MSKEGGGGVTARLRATSALLPAVCPRIAGSFATMELGNGGVSDDGRTFFASWVDAKSGLPLLMAIDIATGQVRRHAVSGE